MVVGDYIPPTLDLLLTPDILYSYYIVLVLLVWGVRSVLVGWVSYTGYIYLLSIIRCYIRGVESQMAKLPLLVVVITFFLILAILRNCLFFGA